MTDDEFKAAQMKLFDESRRSGFNATLRLIFGFLCNIAIQLKRTGDRLERIENRLVELKRMAS